MLVSLVLWLKEGIGPGLTDISSGWQVQQEQSGRMEWTAFTPEEAPQKNDQSLLTLKKKLPCPLPPDAALFLPPYSVFQAFKLTLGDDLTYSSGKLSPAVSNRHLYLEWHMIPLGEKTCGKDLLIRFYSDHHQAIGLMGPVYIGSRPTILSDLILRDLDITVLAFLMIIAGMATLILFGVDGTSRKVFLALFSAMALSAGVYILTESRVTQFFIPVTPLFSQLHYISFFTFTIGMAAFVEKSLGPGTMNIVRRIWQILALVLAFGLALDLLSIVTWDISFSIGLWILLILLVPLGIELVRTSINGKYEARILCTGFTIFLGFAIIDLMAGLQVIHLDSQTIFPWGLLLLLFSFMWVMVYAHREERKKIARAKHSAQEAITEERHRIAREIHDGLAQDLAAMNMKAGLWKHYLDQTPHKLNDEFTWFETLISKNIKDVRRCIFALRPIDLEKFEFKGGISHMVQTFENQYQFEITYTPQGLDRIPSLLEPVLYRIIQESLNNIAKHAQASQIRLHISTDKKRLNLMIEDNGKGFVSKTLDSCYKKGHLGVKQIRERVKEVQGEFSLQTGPEKGTSISITIPLNIQ